MKKLLILFGLVLVSIICSAQDLTFDSVGVISPYWGLKFESGASGDPSMNCGQTNTNFQTGQPYLLARFPIRLANMGTNVAYFGRYGVNGITHDSCYSPQFTNPTDFINIPNFVLASITDSCGTVIASSRKTDWNIQNNSTFALSKYNGQWTYMTNYFGTQPTTGTTPNINKEWLESLCGRLDTNLAINGKLQMDAYYHDCVVCDSIVLFPNYASDDYSVIQLPTSLLPGNYKLVLSGNFASYEASNCYPNTITFPFSWDGSVGQSNVYPYFANGITYLSSVGCTPLQTPVASSNVEATLNGSNVNVTWQSLGSFTSFQITPIYVQGNTERRLTNRTITSTTTNVNFDTQTLIQDARALGQGNGPTKYRFGVITKNGNLSSGETKTKQTVNLK